MLLSYFSSYTKCWSSRRDRRVADGSQGPVSIPMSAATALEGAPEAFQAPTIHNTNCLEPPFLIDLDFFTLMGEVQNIRVTVDYSVLVNVMTNKCLKELGFEPLQLALSSPLGKLAAKELPGHCGWQRLNLVVTKYYSREIEFLIVSDDYRCDLLLGREFKGVELNPRAGAYPNFKKPKSKGTLTRAQRSI
jgi:hypothetical protein